MNKTTRLIFPISALFVFVLAASLFLYNLGNHSISLRSDEVIYVRVTQGIVHTGELFNLTHGPAPFFHKPPLKFWINAIAPSLFGESNFTYRVADAFLGLITILMLYVAGVRIFKDKVSALIACILFLSSLEIVIGQHGFRRAALDGLLVCLTTAALYTHWRLLEVPERWRRYSIFLGVIVGCSVLTKSVAGFIAIPPLVVTLLLFRKHSSLDVLKICVVVLFVALGIASMFYVPKLLSAEKASNVIFGSEIFTRAISGYSGHNTNEPFFYITYLFNKSGGVPGTFLLFAVISSFLWFKTSLEIRFLLVWSFLPVLIFSFAASKTPWYISPVIPAMSLLTAFTVTRALSNASPRLPRYILILLPVFFFCGAKELYAKYEKIFTIVKSQTIRIPLDRAVNEIKSSYPNVPIYMVDKAISKRTKPVKGRFNVDGFYREMLSANIREVETLSEAEAACVTQECLLFTKERVSSERFVYLETIPLKDLLQSEVQLYRTEPETIQLSK